MKIFIYLQNDNSKIADVSLQLISKTKEMTANYDNVQIIGLFISQENCDKQNSVRSARIPFHVFDHRAIIC